MARKYRGKKYQLGIALQASPHKGAYGRGAGHESAEMLVRKGHSHHRSYAHVAKELNALANISERTAPTSSAHFRAGAKLARERAYEHGEYGKSCPSCGDVHNSNRIRNPA